MKLNYLLCADAANVTKDGKAVLFGIFNQLYAAALPAVHPTMSIAYEVSDADLANSPEFQIEIKEKKTGKAIFSFKAPLQKGLFGDDVGGIVNAVGLRFDEFGDYEIELKIGDSVVGTSRLRVVPQGN